MKISLENECIEVNFDTKGAELQQLTLKANKVNYMWRGDGNFWGKFSPILFPIVGALKNNQYTYGGEVYNLPRHGFARDLDFDFEKLNENEILFTLVSTAETLKIYPFKFQLFLHYKLEGACLSCTYRVVNTGSKELLFSIGGHPAFAAPLNQAGSYTDYALVFNNDDEITYHHIDENLISDETTTIVLKENTLPLNYSLFDNDALVFKNLKSTSIKLINTINKSGLDFRFQNFFFFGIWAAPNADFVCLEPWCGIADGVNASGNLTEKEGIETLIAGQTWERTWQVNCF